MLLTGDPEIDRSLEAPIARLRKNRIWYFVAIVVVNLLAFAAAWHFAQSDFSKNTKLVVLLVFLGPALAGLLAITFKRKSSAAIMPHIVRAMGFSYQEKANQVDRLRTIGLLPIGTIGRAEDKVTAELAGRSFESGDFRITTGGKNKTTLFNGLVVSLNNPKHEEWLLLGKEADTTPTLFSRSKLGTRNLSVVHRIESPSGQEFLVYMKDANRKIDPGLSRYLETLLGLERLQGCRLFAILRSHDHTNVALTHPSNPFSIGGLFFSRASLQREIQKAVNELKIPLKVVETILEAERALKAVKAS